MSLALGACGGDDGGAESQSGDIASASESSTAPTTNDTQPRNGSATSEAADRGGSTTDPPDPPDPTGPRPTEPPVDTLAPVRTQIIGTAVAGSSGGVADTVEDAAGQTNTNSEALRLTDGSCRGWDGPGGRWTQGIEPGAPVTFLDDETDEQIGSGTLGPSSWVDVDTDVDEQWNCNFSFVGEIGGTPNRFKIKVGDLDPWVVIPDPTMPGQFVTSVDTRADVNAVASCASPADFITSVSEWNPVVGAFWADGIGQLCDAGLAVTIDRVCRPDGFASEYITGVISAADPAVVFEDTSGVLVDTTALAAFTPVVVEVAVGRPC